MPPPALRSLDFGPACIALSVTSTESPRGSESSACEFRAGFQKQASVINGFSDLILELFGPEIGAHRP